MTGIKVNTFSSTPVISITTPHIRRAKMKSEMYSVHAEKYDSVIQNNIYNAHLERPSLQALIGDVNGLEVIDLGCGTGIYAQYLLANHAKSVTCVDLSQEMVDIVKEKLGDRVEAYAQDLAIGLPKQASSSIDLIICPLVLHYIKDLTPLFKEVHRILKNTGKMVFSTHHPFADFEDSISGNYFEKELISQQWNTVGEPVNVQFYRRSLTELISAMTINGLVVSEISEGKISEEAKDISFETYEYLSKNPNFIFITCQKG